MQMILTEEKADLYDAALDHVNDVRFLLGLNPVTELERGLQAKAASCPVVCSILKDVEDRYNALSWQRTTVYHGNFLFGERVIYAMGMSDLASQFQKAFDAGEFPELIAE